MRDIKFRAYQDGKMLTQPISGVYGTRRFLGFLYEDTELMQYTGLKDSKDKEIFENDIVQFCYWWFDGNERDSILTGVIVYDDKSMSFQLKGVKNKEWESFTGYENNTEYLTPFSELNFQEADFEIIGNIHENPELLK